MSVFAISSALIKPSRSVMPANTANSATASRSFCVQVGEAKPTVSDKMAEIISNASGRVISAFSILNRLNKIVLVQPTGQIHASSGFTVITSPRRW
ncbi:Uncharacterised protein [Vibrio cholerae]|nr:Uncharacterised protein [Vibrio cholerae]